MAILRQSARWALGSPSKVSREKFIEIDKTAVLDFATACKAAGVQHFQLLGSVGASPGSASFFLKTKGQLEDGMKALKFERLSLFHPSMILTPENRYGFSQAVTLAVWPIIQPLFIGPLSKFKGIKVERLGRAIALNMETNGQMVETLEWNDFVTINQSAVTV